MTRGGDYGTYGDRTPALWFCYKKLSVCMSINGDDDKCRTPQKQYQANTWIKIHIKQQVVNGKYTYSVTVNDESMYTIINNQPEDFYGVKVYASNPWDNKIVSGKIRNLLITTRTSPGKV